MSVPNPPPNANGSVLDSMFGEYFSLSLSDWDLTNVLLDDLGQPPYLERGRHAHVAPSSISATPATNGDDGSILTQRELIDLHERENVIIQTHNDILVDPPKGFVEFIQKLLDYDEVSAKIITSAEIEGFYKVFCEEGRHIVYYPKISNMGKLNPYRKHKTAKRSSSRLVKQLLELAGYLQNKIRKGIYVIALELTFPKEFSYKLLDDFYGTIETAKACFKDFYEWLKSTKLRDKNEELGLSANLHLWSTKNPFEPHIHFHLNWINLIWKRDEEKFIRFSPKVDVDKIQEVWKEILQRHGIDTPANVDVHIRFIPIKGDWKSKNDLFRRFRYCQRSVILDFCRFFEENEFDDSLLSNKEYLLNLIFYVNRRVNYGWLRYISKIIKRLDEIRAEEFDDFTKEEEELILKDLERLHGFVDEVEDLKPFDIPSDLLELFYNAKDWYCPICGGRAKLLDVVTHETIDRLIHKGIKYYKWDQNKHRWVCYYRY